MRRRKTGKIICMNQAVQQFKIGRLEFILDVTGEKEIPDDHMFRWIYEDLIDLVRTRGFKVVKEHWQKPPFTCIYLSAMKRSIVT